MKQNVLVFDVESISLHGTAYAVGAVVANREFQMPYPLKDISTIVDISIDRYQFYKLHCDERNICLNIIHFTMQ